VRPAAGPPDPARPVRSAALDIEVRHLRYFVAVAREQGVRLITADRQILREFPHIAQSLENFLSS
jgi:predicted nucleic acid-binding protein